MKRHTSSQVICFQGRYRFRESFCALLLPIFAVTAQAQPGGVWEPPFTWPLVGAHLVHQPNGEILTWGDYTGATAHTWDPVTNVFTPVPNSHNIFCSGHAGMADGRYMIAGGFFTNSAQIFDFYVSDPGTWVTATNLNFTRFYPTCTTLPDGRILTVSGYDNNGYVTVPEIYDPANNSWTVLNNANMQVELYPFDFLLPDGRIFYAGPSLATHALNVATQTWSFVANSVNDGGSAVMYAPGLVMKCGSYSGVSSTTEVINMNAAAPSWQTVGSMAYERHDHNLTILPDGTVLTTGGHDNTGPVFAAELFHPSTNQWTTMASMVTPRQYHSTAQLLRDGRVVAAGADGYPSAEIFNPPYLFQGPRPVIYSAPSVIHYATRFRIQTFDADYIKQVNLVRLGAVTHSFDQNQRFVPLKFDVDLSQDPPSLVVRAPQRPTYAPPGAYMLFLINGSGVPSMGQYVFVLP